MVGSLWAASQGISAIIKGLNKAYGISETRNFIKLNSIALISTIGVTIMIIFSFVMIVFGKIIGTYVFSTLIILLGGELNSINRYSQNKEKVKKYDSFKLGIPLMDKFFKVYK